MDDNELTADQVSRLIGVSRVKLRGRAGAFASVRTVREWMRDGYCPRGHNGPPIFLRCVLIGQEYCTMPEWVEEFDLARARLGLRLKRPVSSPATARRARAENRRAMRDLEAAGVGGRKRA